MRACLGLLISSVLSLPALAQELPPPHAAGEARANVPPQQLRTVIDAHVDEVRACYARAQPADPPPRGRVVVRFDILGDGQVAHAGVQETSLHDPAVERCLAERLRSWHFPALDNPDARVIVSYPFVLEPPAPSATPLDPGVIRAVMRTHDAAVRDCYEARLAKRRGLAGRFEVELHIAGDGSVAHASMKSATMHDAELERCILALAPDWHFPAPDGGKSVVVVYPFSLAPPERR